MKAQRQPPPGGEVSFRVFGRQGGHISAVQQRALLLPAVVLIESSTHCGTAPVQQHPLVGLGELENVTDLSRRHAFDVAEEHDGLLGGGKPIERRLGDAQLLP